MPIKKVNLTIPKKAKKPTKISTKKSFENYDANMNAMYNQEKNDIDSFLKRKDLVNKKFK